jgi:hypothetical protein
LLRRSAVDGHDDDDEEEEEDVSMDVEERKPSVGKGAPRPFLNSPLAPRVKLTPRGEICFLGGMFTPSFTPKGEHPTVYLEEWRGKQRISHPGKTTPRGETSPTGDKIHPWGTTSLLESKLAPGAKLRMDLCFNLTTRDKVCP